MHITCWHYFKYKRMFHYLHLTNKKGFSVPANTKHHHRGYQAAFAHSSDSTVTCKKMRGEWITHENIWRSKYDKDNLVVSLYFCYIAVLQTDNGLIILTSCICIRRVRLPLFLRIWARDIMLYDVTSSVVWFFRVISTQFEVRAASDPIVISVVCVSWSPLVMHTTDARLQVFIWTQAHGHSRHMSGYTWWRPIGAYV